MSEPAPPAKPGDGVSRTIERATLSHLTRRILAINLLAPLLLVGGLLYIDQNRQALIEARIGALFAEGSLMAGALGETALGDDEEGPELDPDLARLMVRRMVSSSSARARLFDEFGEMIADSRFLVAGGRNVVTRSLPPVPAAQPWYAPLNNAYNRLFAAAQDLPLYVERPVQSAEDFGEVAAALKGEWSSQLRLTTDGRMLISVAMPVQGLRQVLGALMLSSDSTEIDNKVREERFNILKLFVLALIITIGLSVYLAGTIARPIRRLAEAAEQVRLVHGRRIVIPDFSARNDEIGDLSTSIREMTDALYQRMGAIESFAADVAHELKNPLTSLRSAVETFARVDDPAMRKRLADIIQDDVARLNRLITDISDASRLDAELSRAETSRVDFGALAEGIVGLYRDTAKPGAPKLELAVAEGGPFLVPGVESRLGQVIRNILDNAISFSPPGGTITLRLVRDADMAVLHVEDQGPGIPEEGLSRIFDRFYSERPVGEAFGTHSGLGLSIARQIIETFRGQISAINKYNPNGNKSGAIFSIKLPILPPTS